MPGRLISHNFLILGASQVQQMLLLPPLLNKVGREERNLSIVFFHWNQNKHRVCGILSNGKPSATSSFLCYTKTDKNLPLCFLTLCKGLTPTPILLRIRYSYSHSDILIPYFLFVCFLFLQTLWFWTWHLLGALLFLSHSHTTWSKWVNLEGFHWNKRMLSKYC